jgi:hypothetical protein
MYVHAQIHMRRAEYTLFSAGLIHILCPATQSIRHPYIHIIVMIGVFWSANKVIFHAYPRTHTHTHKSNTYMIITKSN